MTINWNDFTPYSALIGGALIGLAATILILANGRVAGISGIVSGLLSAKPQDSRWRIAFIAGLIAAPILYSLFATLPQSQLNAGWPVLLIAGLLVGFGSRYGSGCTSGHGVCGISRLSPRSIVATLSFMSLGFATVYVMRHLIG